MIFHHIQVSFTGGVVGVLASMQWGMSSWQFWCVLVGWATISSLLDAIAVSAGQSSAPTENK